MPSLTGHEPALDTLSEREAGVVSMRFGPTDGQPKTLDGIGKVYGVTRRCWTGIRRAVRAPGSGGARAGRFIVALSMPRRARCRALEPTDPALGCRGYVPPGSPADLVQTGTRISGLVSPGEDALSGAPGHMW
jgi:hypothetical protein